MTAKEILETLEKQLQLLSERSEGCASNQELTDLSQAMVNISQILLPY